MSTKDCLSWDDESLNLDALLGEYTDYENKSRTIDEKRNEQDQMYVCPCCAKELKSISGFRGHVTKKHGLTHLKASEHRQLTNRNNCGETNESKTHDQTKSSKSSKSAWIPDDVYERIFETCFHMTNKDIQENPIHNIFGRSPISIIADFCDKNNEIMVQFKVIFVKLAAEPVNLVLSADREQLFQKLHEIRLGKEMCDLEKFLIDAKCPCLDDVKNFLQIFMLQMTNSLLENLATTMKKTSIKETESLSENDQKILYYIAGYIIYALKLKYKRLKNEKIRSQSLAAVEVLKSDNICEKFVQKYTSFLVMKNKGGLQHPCDNFFLLTRSMETVVRKISAKEHTASVSKCEMIESIMEDYMAKYYMDKLFPCELDIHESELPETTSPQILEDMVNLFITIRGFAVARIERNKLAFNKLKESDSNKYGSSFCEALKEKCIQNKKQ